MKRYLVFAGDHYYPHQAWNDFKGSYDDLELARKRAEECLLNYDDWYQIVDSYTESICICS